jgi:hypothetical protein
MSGSPYLKISLRYFVVLTRKQLYSLRRMDNSACKLQIEAVLPTAIHLLVTFDISSAVESITTVCWQWQRLRIECLCVCCGAGIHSVPWCLKESHFESRFLQFGHSDTRQNTWSPALGQFCNIALRANRPMLHQCFPTCDPRIVGSAWSATLY